MLIRADAFGFAQKGEKEIQRVGTHAPNELEQGRGMTSSVRDKARRGKQADSRNNVLNKRRPLQCKASRRVIR